MSWGQLPEGRKWGSTASVSLAPDGTIWVADRCTNTGQYHLPQTGYGYNLGAERGIRIGSARDGSVSYFIPDPCSYPYANISRMAEDVTVDLEGNVYGADYLGDVRRFVKSNPAGPDKA